MLYWFVKRKIIRQLVTRILIGKGIVKEDDLLVEMLENTSELNIVYTSKSFQLQSEAFNPEKYKFVGASIGERKRENNIPYDQMSNKIVYISMGTIFNTSIRLINTFIQTFSNMDVTIIISVGSMINIDKLGIIPSNFYIYPFVDQLEVLKHADVFITHGGMNSANEAIYYATPVVVIPQEIDQPMIAKRIEELYLGKMINKKNVTASNLREAVREVLENSVYNNNMMRMSKEMQEAGGNQKAVMEIEGYLHEKGLS